MRIVSLVIVGTTVLFWYSIHRSRMASEQPVPKQVTAITPHAGSESVNSSAATAAEVRETLQRIFADALIRASQDQWFTTGDFNGDGSPDLAVRVLPMQSKLKTINDPLANWTIQDATHAYFPPTDQRVVVMPPKPRPQSVRANEPLLVVIHGYGPNGWRDPRAQQAYLVLRAGTGPIESRPAPHHIEAPASVKHLDVIYKSSKPHGFVFWTGSQYAWSTSGDNGTKIADTKSRD